MKNTKISNNFFKMVSLLEQRNNKPDKFNIFSVLRSESDEVRLHSRFLHSILDPLSWCIRKTDYLESFLNCLGIHDFDLEGITVEKEYKNIDIFITNSAGQAIIIENKIYAADQEGQLCRYYSSVSNNENKDIYVIYLTLDGDMPNSSSVKGFPDGYVKSDYFLCISYKSEIIAWMESCLSMSSRSPQVRESISQYIDLIRRMTSMDQDDRYLYDLKAMLLEDSNVLNVSDINRAYTEILIDRQLMFWETMKLYQKDQFAEMASPRDTGVFSRDKVSNFYYGTRKNKYFGLYYEFKDGPGGIGIEIGHDIYYGVYCDKASDGIGYNALCEKLDGYPKGRRDQWWPIFTSADGGINFKNPSRLNLENLMDDNKLSGYARSTMDKAHDLWMHIKG